MPPDIWHKDVIIHPDQDGHLKKRTGRNEEILLKNAYFGTPKYPLRLVRESSALSHKYNELERI